MKESNWAMNLLGSIGYLLLFISVIIDRKWFTNIAYFDEPVKQLRKNSRIEKEPEELNLYDTLLLSLLDLQGDQSE